MSKYLFFFLCILSTVMQAMQQPNVTYTEPNQYSKTLKCYLRPDTCPPAFKIYARDKDTELGRAQYEVDSKTCELEQLDVWLEKDRNKGIGSELFDRALEHMKQKGCSRVTWEATQSAIGFYLKKGSQFDSARTYRKYPHLTPMYYEFTQPKPADASNTLDRTWALSPRERETLNKFKQLFDQCNQKQ